MKLRGYMGSSTYPSEGAVLIFARTAKEAKRLSRPYMDEMACEGYTDIRIRWLRRADPKAWNVSGPCVLTPVGCRWCEQWHDVPEDPETGLCEDCLDDFWGEPE